MLGSVTIASRVLWGWMRSHDRNKNGSCRFNLLTWGVRHLSVPMGHVSVERRMCYWTGKRIPRNPQPTSTLTISTIDRQSNLIQNMLPGVPCSQHFKVMWEQLYRVCNIHRATWRTDIKINHYNYLACCACCLSDGTIVWTSSCSRVLRVDQLLKKLRALYENLRFFTAFCKPIRKRYIDKGLLKFR